MLVLDNEGYSNNLGNGASEVFQIQTEFLFLFLQGMVSLYDICKEKIQNLPKEALNKISHQHDNSSHLMAGH